MNYEKYLPIGTVVMLNNGKKRVMITGFLIMPNNEKQKLYDYSGCLYPEGIISSEQSLVFNHEDIKEIYYVGLMDEEYKGFVEKLKKISFKDNNAIEANNLYSNNNSLNNDVEDIVFEELN